MKIKSINVLENPKTGLKKNCWPNQVTGKHDNYIKENV